MFTCGIITNINTIIILNKDNLPIFEDSNGVTYRPFDRLNTSAKIYVHPDMVDAWNAQFNKWGVTNEILSFNEEGGIW